MVFAYLFRRLADFQARHVKLLQGSLYRLFFTLEMVLTSLILEYKSQSLSFWCNQNDSQMLHAWNMNPYIYLNIYGPAMVKISAPWRIWASGFSIALVGIYGRCNDQWDDFSTPATKLHIYSGQVYACICVYHGHVFFNSVITCILAITLEFQISLSVSICMYLYMSITSQICS